MTQPSPGDSASGPGAVTVLSLASDLGMGQPMEHALRQCLIGMRLAECMGLDESDRDKLRALLSGLKDEHAAYVMKCFCLPEAAGGPGT